MAEIEKLVVSLEARVSQYEKALAKARATTDKQMAAVESRFSKANRHITAFGASAFSGLAKGALLALAPILSLGAAIRTAAAGLKDFDAIGKSAKAAGFGAQAFQEYAYAAELGGLNTEQFSKSLETMAKNTGLAAVGKGRLVTQLKALNPELLRNLQLAVDQESRLRLVADALNKESDASKRASISAAVFGDNGTRMIEVLKGGSRALDDTAAKARQLGLVIDADLIAKSEKLNDELETAQKVMDLQFKRALIDLTPFLVTTAQLAGALASAINGIVDAMRDLSSKSTGGLEAEFREISNLIAASNPQRNSDFMAGAMDVFIPNDQIDEMTARRDAILAELRRRAVDQLRVGLGNIPRETPDYADRDAAAAAAIKQAEAVKKLIADLEHERSLIGLSSTDQAVANALRQAGSAATDEQRAHIESLIRSIDSERAAIEANTEAMEAFGAAAKDALRTFIDDMIEGKDLAESFGGILKSLGSQLINAGLSGLFTPGGASIFNIPKRASGGSVRAGQPYIVGERRAELFVPSQSGTVVPSVPTINSGTASGGVAMTYAPQIDARGADSAAVARLEEVMARQQAEFELRVRSIVANRSKRGW
jgi:hypothetical protein